MSKTYEVVFRPGYFAEPILVEGGFSSASDAWKRADEVILDEFGHAVGVRVVGGRTFWSDGPEQDEVAS